MDKKIAGSLGISAKTLETYRQTLGKDTTQAHIGKVLETLPGIVQRLREMSPIYESKQ